MEVNIRKATDKDYPVLCELFGEVDAFHVEHLPDRFRRPAGPVREREYYQRLVADANVGLFLAEADGRPAGFVHAMMREAPAIPIFVPRRYAVIEDIGVKRELRKLGIGRMLMLTAQDWAMAKGASTIELQVYEFNKAAIAFYESLGYECLIRTMTGPLNPS